jgi:hypothetical protein
MRLPDVRRSRAILLGCSQYADPALPDLPAVQNNITTLASILTGREGVGLPPENCLSVIDQRDVGEIGARIQSAADNAEDLLLVYYSGHGLVDLRGRLYLALPQTKRGAERWTALEFNQIREVIADSSASNRVLVLDCCFSGRAIEAMSDSASLAAEQVEIEGTYTLTSTSANAPSHAPIGGRYTAFTGKLISFLTDGIPDGPEFLTLDEIYRNLIRAMRSQSSPRPERKGTLTAGELALVRNRLYVASRPALNIPSNSGGYPRPEVPWYCMYCGWKCTESFNDYMCKSCNQLRPWAGGSATMRSCRKCEHWSLALATYCEWCGARMSG